MLHAIILTPFIFSTGFFLGTLWASRPTILKDHDPNQPFTSQELLKLGIRPPEKYEDWLERYARQ